MASDIREKYKDVICTSCHQKLGLHPSVAWNLHSRRHTEVWGCFAVLVERVEKLEQEKASD